MKIKLLIIVAVMLLVGCTGDEQKRRQDNLEHSVPVGSKILEHVPTVGGWTGYVIFKFRDECFMLYSQTHQRSVTRVTCK